MIPLQCMQRMFMYNCSIDSYTLTSIVYLQLTFITKNSSSDILVKCVNCQSLFRLYVFVKVFVRNFHGVIRLVFGVNFSFFCSNTMDSNAKELMHTYLKFDKQ